MCAVAFAAAVSTEVATKPPGDTTPVGSGGIPAPTQEPTGLGDDPNLNALAQSCYDGAMDACDDLSLSYYPPGSPYEQFADTCAGRQPLGTPFACVNAFVPAASTAIEIPAPTLEPTGLGDNYLLDGLAQNCYDGDMEACDTMWLGSEEGSPYHNFADTCAGRKPPGDTWAFCEAIFGAVGTEEVTTTPQSDPDAAQAGAPIPDTDLGRAAQQCIDADPESSLGGFAFEFYNDGLSMWVSTLAQRMSGCLFRVLGIPEWVGQADFDGVLKFGDWSVMADSENLVLWIMDNEVAPDD